MSGTRILNALPGLADVHFQYLHERGLTVETVSSAGFRSAGPGDLPRLAGRPV